MLVCFKLEYYARMSIGDLFKANAATVALFINQLL